MSKRTLFLIFALFVITLVLLMMALYTPKTKPAPAQTVTVPQEPIAQTVLAFGSPTIATSSSSAINYSLPVNITTGKNKVTAIQMELQYDPLLLTNVSVAVGSFFRNPIVLLNQIDTKTGRISYAFGINPGEQGIIGKGIAVNLNFSTKTVIPQQTAIIFLPKTFVGAQGLTVSSLKETKNILFTVGTKNSTPSSSPKL